VWIQSFQDRIIKCAELGRILFLRRERQHFFHDRISKMNPSAAGGGNDEAAGIGQVSGAQRA